ncbi:cobalamin biosynthesis protein [Vulcanisaeta thermophila]|uniref:cobalamin biosynthesis protein n=1 Tax=Vulcanisaeta thermophila TaxID=867917 RepID=UPI000853C10D|nr:cobalamin biosynthesis protein [Vulcanisaeta thermophila]
MNYDYALIPIATLLLSVPMDLILGEPRGPLLRIHPVVLTGTLARRLFKPRGRLYGVFLWFVSVTPVLTVYYLVPRELMIINVVLGVLASSYVLKLTYSIGLMRNYVKGIIRALRENDLVRARALTQEIVRRDVWRLNEEHLISAVIESTAESFVDGVASPLLYYALFGLPGALLQRLANTMDSMVGYRGWPYEEVGWFSATVDTILNYIPARLSTVIITIASWLSGLNWRNAFRTALRGARSVPSINSGWPMASFAGALGITLEKPGRYVIRGGDEALGINTLEKALKLFDASVGVLLAVLTLIIFAEYLLIPQHLITGI